MKNNDPFAWLTELCQISSSQEDRLRRSRFACEPDVSDSSDDQDESEDIPMETTPIVIISAPESSEEEKENDGCSQQDQFHTPPEGSFLASSQGQQSMHHDNVAGDQSIAIDSDRAHISKAVDLGRDTDLAFSEEVELAQKRANGSGGDSSGGVGRAVENEVSHSESNIVSISNIQSFLNLGSTDTPMKRPVLVTENLGLKTLTGKSVDKVAKSAEKLISPAQSTKISENNKDFETPRAYLGTESEKSAGVFANWAWKMVTQSKSPEAFQYLGVERPIAGFCSEAKKSEKSPFRSTMKLTSPLKASEILGGHVNFDTPNAHLGTNREEVKEVFPDSMEKLKSDVATPQHDDSAEGLRIHELSEAMLFDTSNDGESVHGNSSAKRKLKFPAEAIRSEIEDFGGNSGFGEGIANCRRNEVDSEVKRMCSDGNRDPSSKNIDDLDGCRSTGPSIAEFAGRQKRFKGKRELPVSIAGGSVRNAQRKNECGVSAQKDNPWEYPILSTLRELEKYSNRDTTLEGLSLLEVMKHCGVTFP